MLPAITSMYFTFKNQDGEYYYPSTQPDYRLVRDFTAVNLDIWVEKDALDGSEPVRIWQIVEHAHYTVVQKATDISYETIIARLVTIDRSMVVMGYNVLALAFGFALLGIGLQHVNRRRDEEGF
jgi:hypothetical protein